MTWLSTYNYKKSISITGQAGANPYRLRIDLLKKNYLPDASAIITQTRVFTGSETYTDAQLAMADDMIEGFSKLRWVRNENNPTVDTHEYLTPVPLYNGTNDWIMYATDINAGSEGIVALTSNDGETWAIYDGGNPVIAKGAGGQWDDDFVSACDVMKCEPGYTGTHTGDNNEATVMTDASATWGAEDLTDNDYWIVNITDGSHGKITSNTSNTVTVAALTGGVDNDWDTGDEYKIISYRMWYQGNDGTTWKIGYATSPDGLTSWTKYGSNPVFSPGAAGKWDDENVGRNTVIKEGSTYKMWYVGYAGPGTTNPQIGYATSSDGISWTRYDVDNPVIPFGDPGEWDDTCVEVFSITKIADTYVCVYEGLDTAGTGTFRVGIATSTDGTTWTKSTDNPILDVRYSFDWDAKYILHPSLCWDPVDLQFNIYYGAWNAASSSKKIGQAKQAKDDYIISVDGYCTDFPNDVRFTSSDEETELIHGLIYEDDYTASFFVYGDFSADTTIYVYCGKTGDSSGATEMREDLQSDYTAAGANVAQLSLTDYKCTYTDLDIADEAYAYYNFGAGYFDASFEVLFQQYTDAYTTWGHFAASVFANAIGDWSNLDDDDLLGFNPQISAANQYFKLHEYNGGVQTVDTSSDIHLQDTLMYFNMVRDETQGANGELTVGIYADPFRHELIEELLVTLTEKQNFQYFYCICSIDNNTFPNCLTTGYVQDFFIRETVYPEPSVSGVGEGELRVSNRGWWSK